MTQGTDETVTLDPIEFAIDRVELELDSLGLYIKEVDYGDHELEVFMIKKKFGEIPSNTRTPNREIKIKLGVKKVKGSITLAEAAHKLQAKIGRIQDEELGYLKRVPDSRSGAAPVVFRLHSAAVGGLQGWAMAHRQQATDVEIRFSAEPTCYGLESTVTEEFESHGRQLMGIIPEIGGTTRGLVRVQAFNEGSGDLRGLVLAMESTDYSEEETAGPAYYGAELDLLGAAEINHSRPGAGNEQTVKLTLTQDWLAILGSNIGGTIPMTHKGVRRLYFRVFDPNHAGGHVELHMEYRANGTTKWSHGAYVKTRFAENFDILDLGEARPKPAVLGERNWEWRVLAKATDGDATYAIEIDQVWIYPTEQFIRVTESPDITQPIVFDAFDTFNHDTNDPLTGTSPDVGPEWKKITGVDTDDFEISPTGGGIFRNTTSDTGKFGKETYKGRAVGMDLNMADVAIKYHFHHGFTDPTAQRWGHFARYVDDENWISIEFQSFAFGGELNQWRVRVRVMKAGVKVVQYETGYALPHCDWTTPKGTILTEVTGDTVVVWFTADEDVYPMEQVAILQSAELPASGDVYLWDESLVSGGSSRSWSNFRVYEPSAEAVCYAGGAIEIRTDSIQRQGDGTEVWGELIPDRGNRPYAPFSGLEGRPCRVILSPTHGDFNLMPDFGNHTISAKLIYYPGFQFMSEAV